MRKFILSENKENEKSEMRDVKFSFLAFQILYLVTYFSGMESLFNPLRKIMESALSGKSLLFLKLETERLILVPVSNKHKDAIFKEFTEEITTYMHPRPATKIEDTLTFIKIARKQIKNGENLVVAILHKETEEFLGCGGLHETNTQTPELGIWIKKGAHGNGYGLEAVEGLKNWAEGHLQYKYLTYPVDERNFPSRRIPEHLKGVIGRSYRKRNESGKALFIVEYWIYPEK